jgi:hypothetical protein
MSWKIYLLGIILVAILIAYIVFHHTPVSLEQVGPLESVPRIIWSYWHNRDIPSDTRMMFERRALRLPNYKHIIVHEDTIQQYISEPLPANFNKLIHQHKADWVRLALLRDHGGCWMDASIIINDGAAIDRLFDEADATQAQLTAFYLEGRTYNKIPSTFIENWLLIAPKDSPLIRAWFDEFNYAITVGFGYYAFQNIFNTHIKDFHMFGVYLTQHTCLQNILSSAAYKPTIILHKAEDTMYKIHADCSWNVLCIGNRLRYDKTIPSSIPYIKLRVSERKFSGPIASYFH